MLWDRKKDSMWYGIINLCEKLLSTLVFRFDKNKNKNHGIMFFVVDFALGSLWAVNPKREAFLLQYLEDFRMTHIHTYSLSL